MWPPTTIGLMVTVTTIGMNGSVAFQTDNAVCLRDGALVSFITRVFSCWGRHLRKSHPSTKTRWVAWESCLDKMVRACSFWIDKINQIESLALKRKNWSQSSYRKLITQLIRRGETWAQGHDDRIESFWGQVWMEWLLFSWNVKHV